MIGGGFLGGGISIVPAGKSLIYASLTTEDGANIPNAVFKAVRTGSTVTANGTIDGRAELLVDAGHTYTVTVTPAGGSYLNNSQSVVTASTKSYAVKFYLYPSKANDASTTASLNALNTSISTHAGRKDNPHAVTKAQVGLGAYPTLPADIGISTATQTALDGTVKKTGDTMTGTLHINTNTQFPLTITTDATYPFRIQDKTTGIRMFALYKPSGGSHTQIFGPNNAHRWNLLDDGIIYSGTHRLATIPPADDNSLSLTSCRWVNSNILNQVIGMVDYVDGEVGTHATRKDNPHSVTKAQVGLSNVDNTSDSAKPISTATQTALNGTVKKTGNESIAGIKSFSDNVEVGTTQVPKQLSIKGNLLIDGNITQNGSTYETHAQQVYTTDDKIIMRDGATGGLISGATSGLTFKKYDGTTDGELSVDSSGTARVGDVGDLQPLATRNESDEMTDDLPIVWDADGLKLITRQLTRGDVGLSNVDNTSDVNKPISTATQTALDAKADIAYVDTEIAGIPEVDISGKADKTYVDAGLSQKADASELYALVVPLMPAVNCAELLTMYKGDVTLIETPLINAEGCTSLKEVFMGCANLVTVKYIHTPNVTNMNNTFRACPSLTSVPEMDTSNVDIMNAMFRDCTSLTSIPGIDVSSVTNMNFMFWNCSSLTSVTFTGNVVPTYGATMFSGTPIESGNGYIFVPDGLVDEYKTADGWSNHASVIRGISEKDTLQSNISMYNMQIEANPTMFKISKKEELEMMRYMEEEEEQLTGMKK